MSRRCGAAGPKDKARPGGWMLKWIDMPPVWLAGFAALAWIGADAVRHYLPGLPLAHPLLGLSGGLLVGGGLLLMGLAVLEMRRAQTTVIPHNTPAALVTSGIFSRSRNPIYLGDALLLAGLCLRWGWPTLLLVPLFMAVIQDRFIRPEEARIAEKFGPSFTEWSARTRRWL